MRIKTILKTAIWHENPIFHQMLGVCSALAVTTKVENALIMSLAVTVVSMGTNGMVSAFKGLIPHKARLMVEMIFIATFVILFDQVLKAYYFSMSKQLGPYVGLIITNCIILGRAEAFAIKNRVIPSLADGLGNGIGYGLMLIGVATFREILGAGTFLGYRVMPAAYEPARAILLAPGAFLIMGVFIWIIRGIQLRKGGRIS
ncbi:NADH:ubiquinone reductase (Na(+)-transporting) subunit D [Myxococcota bacterium]|nr:NADH:ubiquinone reductase (Na(+)-transporting) subunit D [Myxococcota bacterium]